MKRVLKKIIAAPFVLLAAIIILLEDWLWDDLARLAAAIGRWPIFRQLESFIVWLPPYPSLVLFAVPSLLLFPVKFASLYLIARGQPVFGFLVAAAKLIGTALVARIFLSYQTKTPSDQLVCLFIRIFNRLQKTHLRDGQIHPHLQNYSSTERANKDRLKKLETTLQKHLEKALGGGQKIYAEIKKDSGIKSLEHERDVLSPG